MKFRSHTAFAILLAGLLTACGGDYDNDDYVAPMPLPSVIPLPNAFQPEGIAMSGNTIYVGSIPTGAIYRADVTTATGSVLVPAQTGRAAIGLKVDARGRLFVAGGTTGQAYVYDAANGQDLATYTLTTASPTFVNDVVVTSDAAWFTDSSNAVLYRVALPADGSLGGPEAVTTLALTGDLVVTPGAFNLNGIVAAGDKLIAVQSNTGFLFTIDSTTGVTQQIVLGLDTVPNGDGLLLLGQTLFVVQNQSNLLAIVDLATDFASGSVRTRIANPAFDVPTTIAGSSTAALYVVNARFGITVTPTTPYNVVGFGLATSPGTPYTPSPYLTRGLDRP